MKRAINAAFVAAVAVLAAISLSACTTSAASTVVQPHPTYQMSQVDNSSMEVIRSCNRPVGSGVLLTFDDTGSPEQVQAILEALEEHNMQGAFFPTGEWAVQHLDLIDQMKQQGHLVGNHTQTHAPLGKLSSNDPDEFYAEVYPLEGVANTTPMWLRPPYEDGAYDPLVIERLNEHGVQICTWTADTYDWSGSSVNEMLERLAVGDEFSPEPIGEDGVILMHMQAEYTPELIGEIANFLEVRGLAHASLLDGN